MRALLRRSTCGRSLREDDGCGSLFRIATILSRMWVLRSLKKIRHRPTDVVKALVVLAVAGPVLVGGSAAAAFFFLPLPAIVPDPTPGSQAQTSHVYAADGSLIATFHSEHNRELISIAQMPEHLQKAAIAAEDRRFYDHSGFDLKAISRAFVADVRARAAVQGGSTITQQYVKNAFIEAPKRTVFRKVRETLIASQVERTFTKKKILERYLNTVYLGSGSYGVEAASKTYFNKPASQVNVSEAAMLIGMIPAPARFSPYVDPAAAEARRKFVLERMLSEGYLDEPTMQQAVAAVPAIAPTKQQVFRYPWFVDAVFRDLKRRYGEAKVFAGGLRVYTTVVPAIQEHAEKVVAETLNRPKDPHAALVSIEPQTGYVRAVVGGRDYNTEKFNHATQARRQPGSAFKTFVLVGALEDGITPSAKFSGPGVKQIKGWGNKCQCVHNFGSRGYGTVSLEKATVQSINTAYVQIAQRVGIDKIIDVSARMGITERSLSKDKKNLAIAIGGFTEGVTPLEMASAYATLGAGGIRRDPKFVTKVLAGDKVLESGPSDPVEAIDSNVAANATDILRKVVQSGTAERADIDRPAAGKTGTAQDFQNAWFVGYTPELSTAVWMGYSKRNTSMSLVHGVRNVTGGSIPAKMWAAFMKVVLKDVPVSEFPEPGEIKGKDEPKGFRLPARSGAQPTPSPTPVEPSPEPEPSPTEPDPTPSPGSSPSILPLPT